MDHSENDPPMISQEMGCSHMLGNLGHFSVCLGGPVGELEKPVSGDRVLCKEGVKSALQAVLHQIHPHTHGHVSGVFLCYKDVQSLV